MKSTKLEESLNARYLGNSGLVQRDLEELQIETSAAENVYLSGNFAPILSEITAFDLRVHGRIPDELEGRFLRIGPNPIGPVDPAHFQWITATGLVHGLRLRGGRAEWYRSRYTMSADATAVLGKPPIPGPGKGVGLGVNTSVGCIGGRVHALVEAGRSNWTTTWRASPARTSVARFKVVSPPIQSMTP